MLVGKIRLEVKHICANLAIELFASSVSRRRSHDGDLRPVFVELLLGLVLRHDLLELLRQAPSVNSLAVLSARLVSARITLMVAILALLGTSSMTTSNSVFSSTAARAHAAASAAGATATAETPRRPWRWSTRLFEGAEEETRISLFPAA
ncbi:hypothetical protein GW17_00012742 [Ensete ventricosum]|nr:hypothetical protein GW17_00012742 [Ensete ventricosum]